MAIVTVRVDEETKRRMEELVQINWSEILRESIRRKLTDEEGRNLAKAVVITNQLQRSAPKGWDSVRTIRYWREHRYGRKGH